MEDYLKDYDKLKNPNAKVICLMQQKEEIEKEIQKIISHCVVCKCSYLMTKREYNRNKMFLFGGGDKPLSEFAFCPACGHPMFEKPAYKHPIFETKEKTND